MNNRTRLLYRGTAEYTERPMCAADCWFPRNTVLDPLCCAMALAHICRLQVDLSECPCCTTEKHVYHFRFIFLFSCYAATLRIEHCHWPSGGAMALSADIRNTTNIMPEFEQGPCTSVLYNSSTYSRPRNARRVTELVHVRHLFTV